MNSFTLDLNKFIAKTEKKMDKLFENTVTEFFSDVVMATPVDTGNLQANWYPTKHDFSDEYDENTTRGTDDVLFEILDVAKNKAKVAYMSNNAPYADMIENKGWSSGQGKAIPSAPNGMVAPAFARIKRRLADGSVGK